MRHHLDSLQATGGPLLGLAGGGSPTWAPGKAARHGRQGGHRALCDHRLALQRHVLHCRRARSRWFGLGCAAELMHGLLAPRFVTTVAGVAGMLVLGAWWG